jgi:4'-phosphopantetheinyl transferase
MPPDCAISGSEAIDIWTWCLEEPQDVVDGFALLLSDDERAKAARFVHDRHRRHFIVGRARLRTILGDYLGQPPEMLSFVYNAYGKPSLTGSGAALHFNLSHSADFAALAVSDRYQLGIDVEEIKFLKEDIARLFFSPGEYRTLQHLPPEAYLDGFYRCWTRKEAFVKAHGEGLSLSLDSFDVTFDWTAEPRLERLDGDPHAPLNWRILHLDTPVNFAGAVVALTWGQPASLHYRQAGDAVTCSTVHPERSALLPHRNDGSPAARP